MYLVVRPVDDTDEMSALAEISTSTSRIGDDSSISADDLDLSDISEETTSTDEPPEGDSSSQEEQVKEREASSH